MQSTRATSENKTIVIALLFILMMILLLPATNHGVQCQSWGSLLWNERTAYIFIGEDIRGYRFSYMALGGELIRDVFPFGASSPDDNHSSITVLEVNAQSVHSYYVNNFRFSTVEPFQGVLYVPNGLPGGGMMKWVSNHFELPTPGELGNLHEYLISLPNGPPSKPDYDNVEGWSQRVATGEIVATSPTGPVEKDSQVTVELNGEQLTFVMNSGLISKHAYVDLIRAGRAPERIWQLDERSHRVSQGQYLAIFGKI